MGKAGIALGVRACVQHRGGARPQWARRPRIASTYVEDSRRLSRSGVVPDAPTDATALMTRAGKIIAYESGTRGRCLSTVPPPRW